MKGKIAYVVFFIFLALITILFLYVLSPFFYPLFWAAVISSLFRPLFNRLNRKKYRPNLNAAVSLVMIILILILPMLLIGTLLFQESAQIYSKISTEGTGGIQQSVQGTLDHFRKASFFRDLHINEKYVSDKLTEMISSTVTFIFNSLKGWAQNFIIFLFMFAIMIYTLYYFIRDGDKLLKTCMVACPLGEEKTRLLYDKFISTTRAALKSTLILGGIQGLAGGILFWLTGIEGSLIWGLVMVVAAMLPTGSAIVWGPAGIVMLFMGHIWEGVTILVVGSLIIGVVDNLLRPIMVGKEIEMHPVLIFISTLGGLSIFGFSGFILGPVICSLFLVLWDLFEEFKKTDFSNGTAG
jgi:predicted PurR-regulated permease PerM